MIRSLGGDVRTECAISAASCRFADLVHRSGHDAIVAACAERGD